MSPGVPVPPAGTTSPVPASAPPELPDQSDPQPAPVTRTQVAAQAQRVLDAEPVPAAPQLMGAALPSPAPAPPAIPMRPPAGAFPPRPAPRAAPRAAGETPAPEQGAGESVERGATGPQLRRFIKSRAYVPMHELRRRFLINGADDEVTPVDLGDRRRIFVGLPEREGRLLGELLRGGDIGYELSLDPISPIVVGVYPMRPVTRA